MELLPLVLCESVLIDSCQGKCSLAAKCPTWNIMWTLYRLSWYVLSLIPVFCDDDDELHFFRTEALIYNLTLWLKWNQGLFFFVQLSKHLLFQAQRRPCACFAVSPVWQKLQITRSPLCFPAVLIPPDSCRDWFCRICRIFQRSRRLLLALHRIQLVRIIAPHKLLFLH